MPRVYTASLALAALLVALLLTVPKGTPSARADSGQSPDDRIAIGLRIAPVPLDLRGKNRDLVGIGSYIVNAQAGCSGCHTQPEYAAGGDPHMGQPEQIPVNRYLAGGQEFGPFVSRNLTPENGLPAGRTFAQFVQQIRTGIDLDNAHPQFGPLLQVMPWPYFAKMNDRDLRAIYEYLRAIPSLPPTPPGAP